MARKVKSATGASKTSKRGTAKSSGKKAAPKKPQTVSAVRGAAKQPKTSRKAAKAKPAVAKPAAIGTRQTRREPPNLSQLRTSLRIARRSNREILADLLGGDWPDPTPLSSVGYGGASNAALAADLNREGVRVSPAAILAAGTVGDVRNEMNRVRP